MLLVNWILLFYGLEFVTNSFGEAIHVSFRNKNLVKKLNI